MDGGVRGSPHGQAIRMGGLQQVASTVGDRSGASSHSKPSPMPVGPLEVPRDAPSPVALPTLDYLTPEEAELRYRHELPLAA